MRTYLEVSGAVARVNKDTGGTTVEFASGDEIGQVIHDQMELGPTPEDYELATDNPALLERYVGRYKITVERLPEKE